MALRLAVPLWLIWLLLAPATLFVALRFPFGKGRNLVHASVLVATCVIFVMISQVLTRQMMNRQKGIMIPSGPPPWVRLALEENTPDDSKTIPPTTSSRRRMGLPLNISAARSTFDVLIFWTLVSACQAYTWIRQARDQEQQALKAEASATQAQLQALQSQLNPHFLFNSLNAITSLVHSNPTAADEMLTDLSRLLRATLESKAHTTIPLREELQLLECYLEIENTRFGDRLKVVREFEQDVMEIHVPTFILQPLVENAVHHGIERCSSNGTILLSASQQKNHLEIVIKDSGPGFDPNGTRLKKSGIGISNTKQRLRHLYGDQAKLDLENIEPRGCKVTLILPMDIQSKQLTSVA